MGNFVRSLSGETPIPADQPPWTDHALIVVVFMSACYYITSLYKNWEGELSVEDYNRRRRNNDKSWVSVGISDAYRRVVRRPAPAAYTREDQEFKPSRLEVPTTLAWHV